MAIGQFQFIDASYLEMRQGTIDIDNDTIIAVLVTATQAASVTADNTFAQISANELVVSTSPDYVRQTVLGFVWAQTASRNFRLDCALVNFGIAVSLTAKYCYFVRRAGVSLASTDKVIGLVDLNVGAGLSASSTNSDFSVDANATNGLMTEVLA